MTQPTTRAATSHPLDGGVSVGEILTWSRSCFAEAGVDAPSLNALVLLEHAGGPSREAAFAHPERTCSGSTTTRFRSLVARRCRREPLAYVVGFREFYGRQFSVNGSTLIPRPETESLVELALQRMDRQTLTAPPEWELLLLDVGTGSGALAVTLLAERAQWRAVATDVDEAALHMARSNAQRHQVADRLCLAASDLGAALHHEFPLIVANLPYVSSDEINSLAPEVARYEPRQALDGGRSGTAVIERALAALPQILRPGGTAIFEIGQEQASALMTLARAICPDDGLSVTLDAAGAERFLLIDRA